MTNWQEVWRRLKQGLHTVVQSTGTLTLPDPWQLRLLVVDCEAFTAPRGTLDEACRLLRPYRSSLTPALVDEAAARLRSGLRQRLLGESELASELARYQQVFSGVAGEPKLALFLRGVDRADAASIALLQQLIQSAEAPLPLLLGFEQREPPPPARQLLEHLGRVLPREAFCWPEAAAEAEPQASPQLESSWQRLSPQALRVLRAGATIGDRFESEVLAMLLGMEQLDVLALLQEAVDAGVPLEDRGEGRFRCGAEAAEALRRTTLPSLARAWHERLAQLLGGSPAPLKAHEAAAAPVRLAAQPPFVPSAAASTAPEVSSASPLEPASAAAPAKTARPTDGRSEVRAAAPEAPARAPAAPPSAEAVPAAKAAPSVEAPSSATAPGRAAPPQATNGMDQLLEVNRQAAQGWTDPRQGQWWQGLERALTAPTASVAPSAPSPAERALREAVTAPPPSVSMDGQRAAQHAEAAGLWHLAAAQHLAAAEEQCVRGFPERALAHVQQASSLSARVTDPEQRRRLRITALMLEGRARWESPSTSAESSLPEALEALLACRQLMDERDPAVLHAELARLIAGVQYDMGTPAALERALQELTTASQLLLAAGQPLDAACLLNDEAAVWVKLGDPVRAHHLLSRSREVFSKVLASYPPAQVELAETEHLLARLLLQAPARPGRERDALQMALQHGRTAAEAYASLQQPRAVARVQETLARIELRLGHLAEAAQLLDQARQAQLQLGDDVGRARSSAAAADVHASARDYSHALELLQESIALNAAKGLRAGLQINLASLRRLDPELPSGLRAVSHALQQQVAATLAP